MTGHRFRLPFHVLELLERHDLTAHQLRTFLGLYCVLIRLLQDNPDLVYTHTSSRDYRAAQRRDDVGTPGSKDSRWLREAVDGLLNCGLFKHLDISENGRFITYQFSRGVGEASIKPKKFAPLYTGHIKTCRTRYDLLFYSRAALVAGMDYPNFTLPLIGDQSPAEPWSESRDGWLKAAMLSSEMLGHAYLVGPQPTVHDARPSKVLVKAQHNATIWAENRLY